MKFQITGIVTAIVLLGSVAGAQQQKSYSDYWQSYSTVEHTYPSGYPSDVIRPGQQPVIYEEHIPVHVRDCDSPYPEPGVWNRYNNNVANSTYAHWGQKNEPYSCERFLTKPCATPGDCRGGANSPAAPVTFATGNASDLYAANTALIDDLKAMYCLPSHIIYRLKSRNDAAYNRARTGGSPAMPGNSLERTTLAGINGELAKLHSTCMNGASQ